jgi:DNA-binding CsgD family transcriptional regulator
LVTAAALSRPTLSLVDRAALAPAVQAHVVEVDGNDVRFAHPLLRTAAYASASAPERRALHRRLAEVVSDVEERARHLALGADEPDEEVARALDRAASVMAARGAPEAAAELSDRARRLTPRDDVLASSRRALESGWYHFVSGDSDRAQVALEQAVESSPSGPSRARALLRLAWLWHHGRNRRTAVDLYRQVLAEAGDDLDLRTAAHQGLAWSLSLMRDDMELVARHARAAVEGCEELGDPARLADALSIQVQSDFLRGGGIGAASMQRALEVGSVTDEPRVLNMPMMHWSLMLACADRIDEARAGLLEMHDYAVAHGDEAGLPFVLMRLSQVDLYSGRWNEAAERAEQAYELATQTAQRPLEADLLCTKALISAHRGEVDDTRAAAREGLALAEEVGAGIGARLGVWALGQLELSLGDHEAARRRLEPLLRISRKNRIVEPGENRYLGDLIEASVAGGRLDEARDILTELEKHGRALDRPGVLAIAARCRGLVAAAEGNLKAALEQIGRASDLHDLVPLPFERARTLLVLGQIQRRAKERRAARETLSEALADFDALGAGIWADRARSELARIGGRTAAGEELTATERRLAELVAEGCSNKEAAAALFLTPKTVETKLSRIYAKLGIHSRAELTRLLTESKL